ncbi:hypothetical protein V8D89_007005 [Ganoderma adspersum]
MERDKRKLSHKDLFRCALVSRALCEPALRALWRTMSLLPDPLWFLLAPPDSSPKRLTCHIWSDAAQTPSESPHPIPAPRPAPIFAPQLRLLTLLDDLTDLVPSLRAPLHKQPAFTSTLCDRAPVHHTTLSPLLWLVPCLKAFATL